MENILVNIAATTNDFVAGLSDVGEKAKDLNSTLQGVGAEAAIAFAGYTAAIMGTVYAYREQELVGQEVQATIQATGGIAGVTADMVDSLAESLSKSTTFSKTQVEAGEEVLLTFTQIGKDVFPEATQATLDLAQHMGGDAKSAAQILGRALQDPMTAITRLTREGITFTAQQKQQIEAMELSGNMAGAQAVILAAVEAKYGGLATAAAGGTGAIVQVKNAMEELAVQIGGVFAPYVTAAAVTLRDLIDAVSHNQTFVDLGAAVLTVGAAMTGAVTALIAGNFAFKQITTAVEAARIVTEAFGVSARVAMGLTGVGLIIVVGAEIYLHWNTIWPAMQATFKAFCDNVGQAAQGLAKIIFGAMSLDIPMIKAGIAQAADAFKAGFNEIKANLPAATPEMVSAATAAGKTIGMAQARANAAALMAEEAATRRLQFAAQQAADQAIILELEGHTKRVVDLKKQEAATLKQMSTASNAREKADLQKHLKELEAEYTKARAGEDKQRKTFNQLTLREGTQLTSAEQAQLISSIQTQEDAKHANDIADLQRQIAADNTFLQEADKFGVAYATINKFTHDTIYKQTESALSGVAQLTQSKYGTLKSIGQAASVVDIEMKGAQSAMDIYAGFATLPPWIGIPLGIAGAAAAEIFAQEKAAQVLGLSAGGLVTGGIPGLDSVPVMAQQGELMAPPQNFDEVVGSVAAKRIAEQQGLLPAQSTQSTQPQLFQFELVGDLARYVQIKNVRSKALGTYRGS